MKKVFVILIVALSYLSAGSSFGQNTIKLGHINSQLIYTSMPEMDSAQKKIEREATAMQKTLEEIRVDLNNKYEEYLKMTNDGNTSPLILKTKEDELNSINERMQSFQQQAEQSLTEKKAELFKPIQDKAIKAVNDVAAENGFTYIFDIAGGAVAYSSPDSYDILPLVKTKLGLK